MDNRSNAVEEYSDKSGKMDLFHCIKFVHFNFRVLYVMFHL